LQIFERGLYTKLYTNLEPPLQGAAIPGLTVGRIDGIFARCWSILYIPAMQIELPGDEVDLLAGQHRAGFWQILGNPFYTTEPSFLPSFAMKFPRTPLPEALHTMERLWACSDFVAGTTRRSGPGNSQPYTARSKGSGVS
jgi:hypothetical protein